MSNRLTNMRNRDRIKGSTSKLGRIKEFRLVSKIEGPILTPTIKATLAILSKKGRRVIEILENQFKIRKLKIQKI